MAPRLDWTRLAMTQVSFVAAWYIEVTLPMRLCHRHLHYIQ